MARKSRTDSGNETSTDPLSGGGGGGGLPTAPGVSIVIHYRDGVEAFRLAPGQTQVVGRGEPSDRQIPDGTLSRQHARFSLIEGRVLVEDLGSKNGTWFEGQRIEHLISLEIGGEVMLGMALARVFALGAAGGTAIDGEGVFRKHLDEEAARAQLFNRGFAVLAVRAPGQDATSGPRGAWVMRLRAHLRAVDRVSLYMPDTALVLLPETGAEHALRLAQAIASARGDGGAPHLVGVAVHPEAASTAEALVDQAREAASRATTAQPVVPASTAPWAESDVAGDGKEMITGAAMREVMDLAKRVAASSIPVILHGETGTGKEELASFLHKRSRRRGRIVRVNCAAIPASLVESTLFGHERGAFTGAEEQRRGAFEDADKGTLFLDEIGELSPAAQAALLLVLDTGILCRVGSTREVKVDVRVLAATHRDLVAMVKEARFREDLYYRLNTIVLEIPPLRERRDEIERFCKRFREQANQAHGRSVQWISDEAMTLLKAYWWPGNVRELRNAIHRAVVLARGEWLQADDLPALVREARTGGKEDPGEGKTGEGEREGEGARPVGEGKARLQQAEANMIEEALRKAGWHQAEVARQLQMSPSTLGRKIKAFGLKRPKR